MSRESIIKIKEAEESAERIVAEARERAKEMIAHAEADGQALCEATERETAAENAAKLAELRARAGQTAERLNGENAKATEEMKKRVALRRRIAEKIILRGFDKKCR